MISPALLSAALLGLLAAPAAAQEVAQACSPDGALCIRQETYAEDVCDAIEMAARDEGLDEGFFARLLWRESLYDASAVSPVGAQGIAQFMPGTAALRGLEDPFNPAEAILASAEYLRDLERRFGNLGLAAVAYNAGEDRAARFQAGTSGLPGETRAYVVAITGLPAEAWLDEPAPRPDMALDPERPFREACLDRAQGRTLAEPEPVLRPWGVILAALGSAEAADRQAQELVGAHPDLLGGERIDRVRMRVPGRPDRRHVAQVGRDTREEAEALCARLRGEGSPCIVLRN